MKIKRPRQKERTRFSSWVSPLPHICFALCTRFCVFFACNPSHPPHAASQQLHALSQKLNSEVSCPVLPPLNFSKAHLLCRGSQPYRPHTWYLLSTRHRQFIEYYGCFCFLTSAYFFSPRQESSVVWWMPNLAWKWKDLNQTYCVDRGKLLWLSG